MGYLNQIIYLMLACLFHLAVFVFALLFFSAQAVEPKFSQLSERLVNAPVVNYAVTQDKAGYIWIAAEHDGLLRYDGNELVSHTTLRPQPPSYTKSNVNSVISAQDGSLWVGSWGHGFSQMSTDGQTLRRYTSHSHKELTSDRAQSIYQDKQGRIWLATTEELRFVNSDFTLASDKQLPMSLRNNRIWHMTQQEDGTIWFASSNGLYQASDDLKTLKHWPLTTQNDNPLSQEIRALELTHDGIWLGGPLGLFKFSFATQEITAHPYPELRRINTLHLNDSGLLIGSNSGVYHLTTQGKLTHYLGNADVRHMFLDRSRALWLSTRNNGVFTVDPSSNLFLPHLFPGVQDTHALPNYLLQSLYMTDSAIWLGLDRKLLKFKTKEQHYTEIKFNYPRIPSRISSLNMHNNELFAATDLGLFKLGRDELMHKVQLPSSLPENPEITSLHITKDGVFWLGFWERGIVRWHPSAPSETAISHYVLSDLAGDAVIQIQPNGEQLILVSRASGLYQLHTQTGQLTHWHQGDTSPVQLPSDTLTCAEPAAKGGFWLCTDKGLFWLNPDTGASQLLTKTEGLPDPRVFAIQEKEGVLWISTRRGLAMLDLDTQRLMVFSKKDGIPHLALASRALQVDAHNQLWIGTHHGLFHIESSELDRELLPAGMVISRVDVDQLPLEFQQFSKQNPLVLSSSMKRIDLSFSFLEYHYTDLNQYQYRLLGLSDDWIQLGSHHTASFSKLPPGKYQFEVTNSIFPTEANTARLYFTVPAPWWIDYRVHVFAILCISLVAWFLWERRNRKLSQLNQKLNALVTERTQELAEANAALKRQARTDFLTQLPNRLAFTEQFLFWQNHAIRTQKTITLALLDVDHFKQINDKYGHEAGDHVLVKVAHVLKERLRKQDVVARWGGEEFILLLPETTAQGAYQLCEELRTQLAELCLVYADYHFSMSVTFGICTPKSLADELEIWVNHADIALYQGKRNGRNQTVIYPQEQNGPLSQAQIANEKLHEPAKPFDFME